MDFEVCIDSVEGALAAEKYGAKRVELCAALSEGGLTPSVGMIEACVNATKKTEVHVMLRPRSGDFTYTIDEIKLMERDLLAAKQVGAAGVVFGILNKMQKIDLQTNMYLLEKAFELQLSTTFHRAVDVTKNPIDCLEDLINLGFNRILTSGGEAKAADGIETIRRMKNIAHDKIEIMAGSGVGLDQLPLFQSAGIDAIHFTAKKDVLNNLALDMGPQYRIDENKIAAIAQALRKE